MRAAIRGRAPKTARKTRALTALVSAAAIVGLAGCAVGPDVGPAVVTGGGGVATPASSSAEVPPLPAIAAPRNELGWTECARLAAGRYGATAPNGVTLDCAQTVVPTNPDQPTGDTLTLNITRARTAATPPDAAPIVLTSGTDMSSGRALLLFADSPGRALLDKHPVVAVDRRGTTASSPIDCMTRAERTAMVTNGLAGRAAATQSDRIALLARSASSAADGCTETLSPHQLDYAASFAAADLEALRSKWGVDRLALLGVGEGSDVVLTYAANYAGRAGRIILDTPTPFGANSKDRAGTQATGVQAALRTFVQRCSATGSCALGADGTATIGSVLTKGRTGQLDGLSDTQALSAITTALAVAPAGPQGLTAVAAAVAAADRGDTGALRALSDRATDLRTTDGQVVGRCNDVNGPVGQNEIPGLIDAWTKQNPLTGTNAALSLMRCSSWSSSTPTKAPNAFAVAPLVLDGANDPINGGGGADALQPMFIKAGTQPTVVSWDGIGYSVAARSACAADIIVDYLGDAPLGEPRNRGCPTT
ncbi:alpha/beta hydrolase [Gordonia sp. CPCC 205515]|uniref:alpha/beta hydrolase n=1 Tax=Gordonia sp. CPCC 205515 TaxID=3140791 RepID=UPI003AF34341